MYPTLNTEYISTVLCLVGVTVLPALDLLLGNYIVGGKVALAPIVEDLF